MKHLIEGCVGMTYVKVWVREESMCNGHRIVKACVVGRWMGQRGEAWMRLEKAQRPSHTGHSQGPGRPV